MSDIQRRVLCAMQPGCFYRVVDVKAELGVRYGQARYALSRLVRGGVVTSEKRKGDRTVIYLTRQECLFTAEAEQCRAAARQIPDGERFPA